MSQRIVQTICAEDVEKRRHPSKHYVFVIRVTWSDGDEQIIYRRYSQFFDLQCRLLDEFPDDAGEIYPMDRIIPFLPGKILFGRSHIREVALKRLDPINDYCLELIQLPSHISQCTDVLSFFETRQEDISPQRETSAKKKADHSPITEISDPTVGEQYIAVADYEAGARKSGYTSHDVSLIAGETVEVLEKNEKGWWFVSCEEGQGWVPSSFLERTDGQEEHRTLDVLDEGSNFVCVHDYHPQYQDELKLNKGSSVRVLEKNLDGWWLAEFKGEQGRVPACYLSHADTLRAQHKMAKPESPDNPVEIIPNLAMISEKHKNSGPLPAHMTSSLRMASLVDGNVEGAISRTESIYQAVSAFDGSSISGGTSVADEDVIKVLEKSESGWWFVRTPAHKEGWIPSSIIHKKLKSQVSSPKPKPRKIPPPRPNAPPSKPEASTSEEPGNFKSELTSKFTKFVHKMSPTPSPRSSRKQMNGSLKGSPQVARRPVTSQRSQEAIDDESDDDSFYEGGEGTHLKDNSIYKNFETKKKNSHLHQSIPVKPAGEPPKPPSAALKPGGDPPKLPSAVFKPGGDPPKPPSTAFKPSGDPPKPPSAAFKPSGDPPKPPSAALKPAGDPSKPPSAAFKPAGEPPKPPSAALKPAGDPPKPPFAAFKPTGEPPKPPPMALKPPSAALKTAGEPPKPPVVFSKPTNHLPNAKSTIESCKPQAALKPVVPFAELASPLMKTKVSSHKPTACVKPEPLPAKDEYAIPMKLKPVSKGSPALPRKPLKNDNWLQKKNEVNDLNANPLNVKNLRSKFEHVN